MRFGTLHAGRIGRHRRPDVLSAAALDIPRQAIGTPLLRFVSLQRLPAGAALCGVANSHTMPLRRCPPAQWLVPAVFRSRPNPPPSRSSRGRSFPRRPVLLGTAFASAAAHTGHSPAFVFSLTYRARACRAFRTAWPLSFAGARQRSWDLILRSVAPASQLAEVSAATHLPFSRPCRAWAYVFPRTGRCVRSFRVPTSRGLSIAASGFSGSPAVPSRHVGIGRYCLGLFLFQGCRARFAWCCRTRAGAGLDTCRRPPVPGRMRASTPAWLHGPSAHELGPLARSSACWRNRRLI
jgi:hypothetical protein